MSLLIRHLDYVPSEPGSVRENFLHAAQKHTEYSFLHVLVAVYRRSQRFAEKLEDVFSFRKFPTVPHVFDRHENRIVGVQLGDVVSYQNGPETMQRKYSLSVRFQTLKREGNSVKYAYLNVPEVKLPCLPGKHLYGPTI